ncbi:Putative emopamil-binding protein [Septoria linicola]|uniref:Emopamil-binding protein n=1 Tax=Septoria linicola TaxID=215465 RepID=A0A9Q9ASW2_9PEZI|nr:putative emopamil-binding protein [Septoria linicola]USW51940.1 Putative emopamil-binding protein [Septoria linicola]
MADTEVPSITSTTTIFSLGATVAILAVAYLLSVSLLPKNSTTKIRILFVWHAFDALIHFILEGSYLYNCFFSYMSVAELLAKYPAFGARMAKSPYLPQGIYFLGRNDRIYGSEHGTNPFAKLWMEYAKADKRWGGSDLTIISLELLTVFIAGPIAVMICNKLRKQSPDAWFWMTVLATGELYGGFMTFAPEWLTGSPNLVTDNFMYKWVYLVFFNAALWVAIPIWILFESYGRIAKGLKLQQQAQIGKKKR